MRLATVPCSCGLATDVVVKYVPVMLSCVTALIQYVAGTWGPCSVAMLAAPAETRVRAAEAARTAVDIVVEQLGTAELGADAVRPQACIVAASHTASIAPRCTAAPPPRTDRLAVPASYIAVNWT
eukprot:scaffold196624_cov33-Tisochrysis_lutea.AAC.3